MLRGIWVMGAARMGMRRSTMGAAKGCSCSGLHWIASSPAVIPSHAQYRQLICLLLTYLPTYLLTNPLTYLPTYLVTYLP